MTRRFNSRRVGNTTIKTLEKQPVKFAHAICPLNLEEQKERFLKHGKLPKFVLKGSEDEIESLFNKARNQIRFDLFGEAEYILKTVKSKYGDGDNYLTAQFGEKISKDQATTILEQYLRENNLDGAMSIVWCADLASSARMMWIGPHCKHNRPEARTYSFWIKNSEDNNFLREQGIRCLADHEIGTHFFRAFNDGLQPWYSDRKRFDLRGRNSIEELRAEEGLAAINTILNSKVRFLWGPALLYYTACKAAEMTFKQLYDHLTIYVKSPEHRWRLCMRVKRGLLDPNDLGGYGKDQCYFEGAVEILRSLDDIDFNVMMSGKICVDEVQRCKRLARLDCLKLPAFMKNENRYKKHLKAIAHLNGLDLQHQRKNAPAAYIRRLKQGRRIGDKVRRIQRIPFKGFKTSSPVGSQSNDSTGSEYDGYYNESNQTRDGGGEIVHYTPVIKLDELQDKKDSWVERCTIPKSYNSKTAEIPDSISLKSCDSTSIKSTGSPRSECRSVIGKSDKTEITRNSIKSEISINSNQSRVSDLSEISVKPPAVEQSGILHRTTNSSSQSSTPRKLENLKQVENEIQKTVSELIDQFSTNNNAQKLMGRKDILPPLISMSENGQKSWATSRNCILRSNSQPMPQSLNHNVCTTVISSNENGKGIRDSGNIPSQDIIDCFTSRSSTSEVTHDNRVVGFSTLTNTGVIRFKPANQNSVFHSFLQDSIGESHSVTEQGPEKFIYPDFNIFDSKSFDIQSSFSSPCRNENVDFQITRRRVKSATCRRQLRSLQNYPI